MVKKRLKLKQSVKDNVMLFTFITSWNLIFLYIILGGF